MTACGRRSCTASARVGEWLVMLLWALLASVLASRLFRWSD